MMKFRSANLNHDDEFMIAKLVEFADLYGAAKVEYYYDGIEVESTDLTHKGIVELVDTEEDDMFGLYFYDISGKKLGWFGVVLGNDDFTTIYDWTDNEWCNRIGDKLGEYYDRPPFSNTRR